MKTRNTNDLLLESGDGGTRFVMLVVAMMSVLATIALGGALVVGALRDTWVDAVRGHITVEIPASDGRGVIRTADMLAGTAKAIGTAMNDIKGVQATHILTKDDVKQLVKPWMGEAAGTDDLPLPALMGITLKNPADTVSIEAVKAAVTKADAAATVELHQSWISDLRRFSLVLLLAACAMAAITVACCIVSVAGAVAARLAEHQSDIDLLHLMGATDDYIGRQFVQSVVTSVGKAALAGTGIGFVLLKTGGLVAGGLQSSVLPDIGWHGLDYLAFLTIPALVTGLCFMAARVTVLRTLRSMP